MTVILPVMASLARLQQRLPAMQGRLRHQAGWQGC